jgi:hypothetical protein
MLILPKESESGIAYRELSCPYSARIAYRVRVLYCLQRPIASPICLYCLQSQSLVLPTENYLHPLPLVLPTESESCIAYREKGIKFTQLGRHFVTQCLTARPGGFVLRSRGPRRAGGDPKDLIP